LVDNSGPICSPDCLPRAAFQADDLDNSANLLTEAEVRMMELDEFLERVYSSVEQGQVPAAMDCVIDFTDRLLSDGFFGVCNELFNRVDFGRMPSSLRRAFLMITHPAKDKLPARTPRYKEALASLSQERDPETAARMLKTLA